MNCCIKNIQCIFLFKFHNILNNIKGIIILLINIYKYIYILFNRAIFSLAIYLGGDMLPCFFFAVMFSPQLEKNIFKRAKLPRFN